MTNGSVAISEGCLARAGLAGAVARAMDVTAVRRWKPAREVYAHAARELGLAPDQARLWQGSAGPAGCRGRWGRRHAWRVVIVGVADRGNVISLVDAHRRACWGRCHRFRVLWCSRHGCTDGDILYTHADLAGGGAPLQHACAIAMFDDWSSAQGRVMRAAAHAPASRSARTALPGLTRVCSAAGHAGGCAPVRHARRQGRRPAGGLHRPQRMPGVPALLPAARRHRGVHPGLGRPHEER